MIKFLSIHTVLHSLLDKVVRVYARSILSNLALWSSDCYWPENWDYRPRNQCSACQLEQSKVAGSADDKISASQGYCVIVIVSRNVKTHTMKAAKFLALIIFSALECATWWTERSKFFLDLFLEKRLHANNIVLNIRRSTRKDCA